MTRKEFSEGLYFLAAGCRQALEAPTLEAYFALLGDLSAETFREACRVVLLSHKYATLPSIAELREAALMVENARNPQLTAGEAFAIAREAAGNVDMDIIGPFKVRNYQTGEWDVYPSQEAYALRDVPEPVVKAMRAFGLREFCYAEDPTGVVRAQFTKVFEQIAARDQRTALMPPSVREFLDNKRDADLVQKTLAQIGEMPK